MKSLLLVPVVIFLIMTGCKKESTVSPQSVSSTTSVFPIKLTSPADRETIYLDPPPAPNEMHFVWTAAKQYDTTYWDMYYLIGSRHADFRDTLFGTSYTIFSNPDRDESNQIHHASFSSSTADPNPVYWKVVFPAQNLSSEVRKLWFLKR